MRERTWKNIGTILITLSAVMLLGSATAKLTHVPQVVSEMTSVGLAGNRLTLVAALEVFSALLFLIPATRSAGLLLVSAFLGGAIATHLQHGQSFAPPSFVLVLLWVGSWLRHPEILWSWRRILPSGRVSPRRVAEGY